MGLSWDIKWHKAKTFISNSDQKTPHNDADIIVDELPSIENFFEMLELKTGRLFKLSLDLYTAIIDDAESRKSNLI